MEIILNYSFLITIYQKYFNILIFDNTIVIKSISISKRLILFVKVLTLLEGSV